MVVRNLRLQVNEPKQRTWRELAQFMAEERDPGRLQDLAQALIEALDEQTGAPGRDKSSAPKREVA